MAGTIVVELKRPTWAALGSLIQHTYAKVKLSSKLSGTKLCVKALQSCRALGGPLSKKMANAHVLVEDLDMSAHAPPTSTPPPLVQSASGTSTDHHKPHLLARHHT